MKKLLSVTVVFSVMAFLLVSCGGLIGKIDVKQSFLLQDRKGDQFSVPVGIQDVNLQFNSKKNRLTLDFKGSNTTVVINTPENFTVPENGNFVLKNQDSGQAVDIAGTVETFEKRSSEKTGSEQCQYTGWEPVCTTNPDGSTSCSSRPVTKWGWQTIWYFDIETHQKLNSRFNLATNSREVAQFSAYNVWSEKRVTQRGNCW